MKAIGLTGGIGAGKGEVASLLRSLGAAVVEADQEGHRIYRRGTEGWRRVVALFGRQVLGKDKEVDRGRLGAVAFGNPDALTRLNAALHPLIREAVGERLQELEQAGQAVTVVEAPLLLEAGWQNLVGEVWVVWAAPAVVIPRLQRHRGLSTAEARQRIEAQTSNEWKRDRADVVIENSEDLEALRRKVEGLWRRRIQGKD